MLAGLPQSPQRLNPHVNLEGARVRQRWVLDRMVATGYISQARANDAMPEPVELKTTVDPNQGIFAAATSSPTSVSSFSRSTRTSWSSRVA